MKMNLENMKNPQLKGRDSKVVRLIRNSCPFITNFGHVWSNQTRVTHLQNVLCVIRTSVVLILDDIIVKDILKVNNIKKQSSRLCEKEQNREVASLIRHLRPCLL